MNPKEYAKYLIERFYPFTLYKDATFVSKKHAYYRAHQCALININEILDAIHGTNADWDYYMEVKTELENYNHEQFKAEQKQSAGVFYCWNLSCGEGVCKEQCIDCKFPKKD